MAESDREVLSALIPVRSTHADTWQQHTKWDPATRRYERDPEADEPTMTLVLYDIGWLTDVYAEHRRLYGSDE